MGILGRVVGTPQANGDTGTEVVKAKEFDITQYGKKLGLFVGAFVPVVVATLKALDVEVSDAMVIAALGVTAVALFSVSMVMGVDMIARAIVTKADEEEDDDGDGGTSDADVSTVQAGLEVKIESSTDMRPVLAIRSDEAGYSVLVPTGTSSGSGNPPTFEGPLDWVAVSKVRACRVSRD